MKTDEELNSLKKEVETVSRKLAELTEEELAEVFGGLSTASIDSFKELNSTLENFTKSFHWPM